MKRIAIAFTLLFLAGGILAPISEATRSKKKKTTSAAKKVAIPCPDTLNNIEDCLDTGCGPSLDPNLNRRKNIKSLDGEAEPMTIQQMRNLPDPVSGFRSAILLAVQPNASQTFSFL